VMAPLAQLGTPILDISGQYPYRAVQSIEDEALGVKGRLHGYWKSAYLRALTDDVIDLLIDRFRVVPAAGSLINLPHLGGAVRRVGAEESAVGGREAPFMASADAIWLDPADSDVCKVWARETWELLQPYSTGGIFINFTGEERGADAESLVRGAYGSNFERLVAAKRRYDPTNLFRLNQNIPPGV
jgi:hypothetical protein